MNANLEDEKVILSLRYVNFYKISAKYVKIAM